MPKKLRVAIAQLDFFVGDVAGNLKKHIAAAEHARDELKADVIIFPELSLSGYPPEDLLLRNAFIEECNTALATFQATVKNIHCLIGHPYHTPDGLFNTASLIYNGLVLLRQTKHHLPNYGVFDEKRYFRQGHSSGTVQIHDVPVGICICEDLWYAGPIQQAATQGARVILCINASPYELDKYQRRTEMLAHRATSNNVAIIYVNMIGGQDDLIFDGGSMAVDAQGQIMAQGEFFKENLFAVDLDVTQAEVKIHQTTFVIPTDEENIYAALVLGVRDYVKKNNFQGALLGLSGGIDSALILAIAVDALGKENVTAVVLPSQYTAEISLEDATKLIKNLGVTHENISIEPIFASFLASLQPVVGNTKPHFVEENLQARCRGVIMMALSNSTGKLVLTASNRSEVAVGYATLYGDMAGGFDVLKDISKTMVYQLANYRNSISDIIPQRVLTRAPTAELAPNQKDEDSLPPYSILDPILELYLNEELGLEEITAAGFDRDTVKKVINLIHKSEYKRRQSPPGPRINITAFGRDRRYPISSGFKG
jgi:NAD+ synthase (glutamine-hydrolysing)